MCFYVEVKGVGVDHVCQMSDAMDGGMWKDVRTYGGEGRYVRSAKYVKVSERVESNENDNDNDYSRLIR